MNRRKIAGALAALAPWLVLAAAAAAQNDERVLLHNLPAQAQLGRSIDCDFQEATLAEVLQFFRQNLEICVVLDPDAAGLAQKRISLTVENMRASTALTLALKQARLQYAIALGVVWVGNREYTDALEPLYYRQYDVSDMVVDLSQGGSVMATGSSEDSNINKPGAGGAGSAGDEALCALRTSSDRRNEEKTAGSSGMGNSSIQKELKENGF